MVVADSISLNIRVRKHSHGLWAAHTWPLVPPKGCSAHATHPRAGVLIERAAAADQNGHTQRQLPAPLLISLEEFVLTKYNPE